MREPEIENVIEDLSSQYYGESFFENSQDWDTKGNKVTELLYFLGKEQIPTLYNKIMKLGGEEKKRIFQSLVMLYPLSKQIVIYLLIKREGDLNDFLELYDMDRKLLNSIQENLLEIKKNSSSKSTKYNAYQNEIENLKSEIEKLGNEVEKFNNKSDELKKKREEKNALEKELEDLERENEEILEVQISELQKEREMQKEKGRKKKEELQILLDDVEETKLPNIENEYQKVLQALQNCIQSIGDRG